MTPRTLFHYTNPVHLGEILASGKLKLTCSNLVRPVNGRMEDHNFVSDTDGYRPVVWLTDSISPYGHGIDQEGIMTERDKARIRIEVAVTPDLHIQKWMDWADENNMDPEWRAAITHRTAFKTWYITEQEIPITSIVEIYDRVERKYIELPQAV